MYGPLLKKVKELTIKLYTQISSISSIRDNTGWRVREERERQLSE